MASSYGGLPAPGFAKTATLAPVEIFASTVGKKVHGVTIAAGQNLIAGTALGRVTASKQFKAYATGNADGSQVPVGVLMHSVDTTDGVARLGNIVTGGELATAKLVGLDAGALTALNARSDAVRGVTVIP
jgi:hypothetical protein